MPAHADHSLVRRRKLIGGTVAVGAALAVAAFLVAGAGGIETYPAPLAGERPTGAPDWTAPCWRRGLVSNPRATHWCARLRARVLWVKREGTERGDGDVHVVTVADRHIRYAKISLAEQRRLKVPGVGDRVTVIGPLVRGAHVDEQVRAYAVER
jgi:hypothetical protein